MGLTKILRLSLASVVHRFHDEKVMCIMGWKREERRSYHLSTTRKIQESLRKAIIHVSIQVFKNNSGGPRDTFFLPVCKTNINDHFH